MADTTTNTYTGDLSAAESRIKSLTQAVSQGYSGLPGVSSALRTSLYEREKTLPALEVENENKIKELYTADQRYAERYANPESEMFIENPMKRRGVIAGQKADIRGELGNILNLIQQRSLTLGNAIDKGMELYKYGLEAQKLELEQAEKEWERVMKKAEFEESKKKGAGGTSKDYSSYLAYLSALGNQTTEEMPIYSPASGVGTMSSGGQWKYTGVTKESPTGWTQVASDNSKLQSILKAAQTNPEVAKVAIENWSDWNPKEETATQTEEYNQDLRDAADYVRQEGNTDKAVAEAAARLNKKWGSKGVKVYEDLQTQLMLNSAGMSSIPE